MPDPSDQRTGTRPTSGPVRPADGYHRSDERTSLTSENADQSDERTGTRPPDGPLEQEIKNGGGSVRAPAPARDTRAPARGNINNNGRDQIQELADSAGVSKDAYVLVGHWRATHGERPYTPNRYIRVGKVVTKLLAGGWAADVVSEALVEWDRRDNAAPGLLPDLCDDALRRRRNGVVTPLIQRDGSCSMPVAQITDEMLTRRVLEELLGPDMSPPRPTPEVEDGDLQTWREWQASATAQRLVERRDAARAQLARQQQRAGSA